MGMRFDGERLAEAGILGLVLLFGRTAGAQAFTNSATLSAATDSTGTNLVITYSLTTTQGWVTLFEADRSENLATTNARPVGLSPVLPSQQGQFQVPIDPAAPVKFYRLLLEASASRGRVRVFTNGPLNFAAMRATYGDLTNGTPVIFNQPVDLWVDNLGEYSNGGNGTFIPGFNGGYLGGKYGVTATISQSTGLPLIPNLQSSNYDFRVNYRGDANVSPRAAILWSSQAQMYYDLNNYRKNWLSDAFIDELHLPASLAANLKTNQYRPDLVWSPPASPTIPGLFATESFAPSGIGLFQNVNSLDVCVSSYLNYPSLPPASVAYDTEATLGDYAGLAAVWSLGDNIGYPSDLFYGQNGNWPTSVLSPINNGLSDWTGYRYTGNAEIYRYMDFILRTWAGRTCGGSFVPCDKGQNIRNVMMFDEANGSKDGVFPYSVPSNLSTDDGPVTSDLAALYVAALFYDIAHEAGLGLHKADLIFWKSLSLVTNAASFTMRDFGGKIQEAARDLWPDPRSGRTGLSLYEDDLVDVLASRGIPVNGVADFRSNLPVAIGGTNLDTASGNGFGSAQPESQPTVNSYGNYSYFVNGYTDPNTNATYMAYQFYKHSKYGPCDKLALTDGTFTTTNVAPFAWSYNNDGTFYTELTDRDLGNVVVFAPGRHIRWMRSRQRCPNEATGFYAEDVRPFGFRVIKATPNGFSFTATAIATNDAFKTYQLAITDPSTNTLGAAAYAWTFTDYTGNTYPASGPVVQYPAYTDQPFTVTITRTRGSQTDTLTLRERGNDLDRSNGQAFVRNLIPGGAMAPGSRDAATTASPPPRKAAIAPPQTGTLGGYFE